MAIYARLGVLYYVIYNPLFWQRDGHLPFEVHKLINGSYQLQMGEPLWMPELELGLGRCQLLTGAIEREALGWFDRLGNRYLTPAERAEQERQRAEQEQQRAEQERQRAERLADYVRSLGLDPDRLPEP